MFAHRTKKAGKEKDDFMIFYSQIAKSKYLSNWQGFSNLFIVNNFIVLVCACPLNSIVVFMEVANSLAFNFTEKGRKVV
jgi:hypothetical protein